MNRAVALLLGLVLAGTTAAALPQGQQDKKVLTTADYDRAVKMLGPSLNGLVVGGTVDSALVGGRQILVRPHDVDRHGERRHRSGEKDA